MLIFVLTPNADALFIEESKEKLESAGKTTLVKEAVPFDQVGGLYEGKEERILAIDPDFCDWKVPNTVIDKIPNLKAICLQTTSFSWIDTDHAKKKGLPVMNLRGFSSIAVAEWATMMVLALARRIPVVIQDGWKQDYARHRGIELRGRIAGVVGLGRIGTAIAENMQGLGMQVQYWSRSSQDKHFKRIRLEELMRTSDVILPAVARNEQTKGLITDEMINSMKKTAIFVSIVHEVYPHRLLLEKATKGEIYGYGFEEAKGEFVKYTGNVWAGPELAWCTNDSMRKNAQQWVESIIKASQGNYETRVN